MSRFRLSSADFDARFDVHRFMAYREDMYDDFDSVFLEHLRGLPSAGNYRISTREKRPDVYSRDIYGSTAYWSMLMEYNGIVSVAELTLGKLLLYPSKSSMEDAYFSLRTGRKRSA